MVVSICSILLTLLNRSRLRGLIGNCKANDRHWCALLDSLLSKVGGTLLFQCNYYSHCINYRHCIYELQIMNKLTVFKCNAGGNMPVPFLLHRNYNASLLTWLQDTALQTECVFTDSVGKLVRLFPSPVTV